MRFKGLDLNLLVVLDTLLATRSVTASAVKLSLSQSAISGALARLRMYFHDDLLVLSGRKMVLTPRAEELSSGVRSALVQVETLLTARVDFDPSKYSRTFVIEASGYVIEVLAGDIVRRLTAIAPKIKLKFVPRTPRDALTLARGECDLAILPDFYADPDCRSTFLFEDDIVVLGASSNERLSSPVDAELFYALPQISVRFGREAEPSFAERHLPRGSGIRQVEITVPDYTHVPRLLPGTERIALMYRRLATLYMGSMPLRLVAPGFSLPPLREVIQHHWTRDDDAPLLWLRNLFVDVARRQSAIGETDGMTSTG